MKFAVYAFTIGLLSLAGVVVWTILRVEDTREKVEVVERRITVDPCKKPQSDSCQRRIALVLRELARRRSEELERLGLSARSIRQDAATPAQGGGAVNSPQGSGPTGRVNPPRVQPPTSTPPTVQPPASPEPGPVVDLEVPLVPRDRVCVGDVLAVNCTP